MRGALAVVLFTVVVFRAGVSGGVGVIVVSLVASWPRLLHHCPEQHVRLGAGHGLSDEMQPWVPVVSST